jgi:hypothetical protein
MRKALTVAAAALAAAAWAADIPNALDKGVLRLGPLLSGGVAKDYYVIRYVEEEEWSWWYYDLATRGGGGAYFWAQYDGPWYGYEARLGAFVVRNAGSTFTNVDWENEYHMYLVRGKFRPYFTPSAGLRRSEGPGGGRTDPLFGIYFGIRLNSPVSPFYMTVGGGYKFFGGGGGYEYEGQPGHYAVVQNRYFFALGETVAAHVEVEGGSEFGYANRAFARVNAGPSFSF